MNTKLLIGIGILGVALLFDIIGTAIPYWWVGDAGKGSRNFGLFQICGEVNGETVCVSTDKIFLVPGWLKGARAMMVMSILALGASLGLGILFGFIMKDNKQLGLLSGVLGAVAGGLALLGVIIFGANVKDAFIVGGLHAGFGLAIVSALIAIGGGIMMVLSRNAEN